MEKIPEKFKPSDIKKLIEGWNLKEAPVKKKNYATILEVQSQWTSFSGKMLSVHTYPYKIQSGILFVRCDHSIFAQQIQFYAMDILQKLNQILSLDIKKIKTSIGIIYWRNRFEDRKKSDNISPKEEMVNYKNDLPLNESKKMDAIDLIIKNILVNKKEG